MTFPVFNAACRTGESFSKMKGEDHQRGPSPFCSEQLGLGMYLTLYEIICISLPWRCLSPCLKEKGKGSPVFLG